MHADCHKTILSHLQMPGCYVEFDLPGHATLCGPFGGRIPLALGQATPQYALDHGRVVVTSNPVVESWADHEWTDFPPSLSKAAWKFYPLGPDPIYDGFYPIGA